MWELAIPDVRPYYLLPLPTLSERVFSTKPSCMRKRLITTVLIIGEQSEKSLSGTLTQETSSMFISGSLTFITSGKGPYIMQYGGEGVGSCVCSNLNQPLILNIKKYYFKLFDSSFTDEKSFNILCHGFKHKWKIFSLSLTHLCVL